MNRWGEEMRGEKRGEKRGEETRPTPFVTTITARMVVVANGGGQDASEVAETLDRVANNHECRQTRALFWKLPRWAVQSLVIAQSEAPVTCRFQSVLPAHHLVFPLPLPLPLWRERNKLPKIPLVGRPRINSSGAQHGPLARIHRAPEVHLAPHGLRLPMLRWPRIQLQIWVCHWFQTMVIWMYHWL
jgi:hypothetical protein